ncbi:YidB family protein [Lichenifustis flavocetrariae]|uniref:YidB family protein n=1 Tax=Lichenifustis flavocetrariae TaxID=2949735 RepID=A0AA41YTQ1_9HYPH|nr:YidB family protein [Lichenifustis flavocetrariae]MCW6506658.1 YidB family protein [Lichenifustis flavocetrariae]
MSWLGGALGNIMESIGSSGIGGQLAKTLGPTVLQSVIAQLNQNGLGPKVNSWLGGGENQPITPDEIRNALGNQKLQEIAASLGIPADKISEILAQALPAAVDHASPNGTIEPEPQEPASKS